jgi:hypothetical protein
VIEIQRVTDLPRDDMVGARGIAGDTESVDDQVEWFDASSLIYFRPTADGNIVWRLLVDGGAAPQPFVREGFSPVVVR